MARSGPANGAGDGKNGRGPGGGGAKNGAGGGGAKNGLRTAARIVAVIRARPRLMLSVLLGLAVYAAAGPLAAPGPTTRFLIAWDAATACYLGLAWHLMAGADIHRMRRDAERQDDGKGVILVLSVLATAVSMVAIVAELSTVPGLPDADKVTHVLLAALTIPAAWLFVHTAFALHYAHDYYGAGRRDRTPGLAFPDEAEPDYLDFLYFSFIVGTAAQTADVAIRARATRRVATAHCTLAFFFNTTVLALTINIAASLIGH